MEFLPKEVEEIILDYTQQLHKAEFIRRVHRKKFQKTLNIINKIKYKFYDNNLRIVYDDFSSFCYYGQWRVVPLNQKIRSLQRILCLFRTYFSLPTLDKDAKIVLAY